MLWLHLFMIFTSYFVAEKQQEAELIETSAEDNMAAVMGFNTFQCETPAFSIYSSWIGYKQVTHEMNVIFEFSEQFCIGNHLYLFFLSFVHYSKLFF